jgi:enamine deaminase RidA (YjgF/YER057c/UK114 family)
MTMSEIERRLESLGYVLPEQVTPVANYVPAVSVAGVGLVYLSGHVPRTPDGGIVSGRLGDDMTVEEGYEVAKQVALALLGTLRAEVGDLDRVTRIVKLLTMVNCTPDFGDQPAVANGASDLLVEVFGHKGRHARSAVGMAALPGNCPVEIEMIVQVAG